LSATTDTAPTAAANEAALRRLELTVTRRLEGLLHGDHQGLVPGGGSEPGEGRVYRPGDDVRRMDWNVTARSSEPHVRDTIADRELETWVVVDGSASLDFGTAACEKRDLALAAVAAFAFLTARSGNRVGCIVVGPDAPKVLPPRAGREAVLALLHALHGRPRAAEGASPLAAAFRRAAYAARRRGLVVVVSDFLDQDTDAWQRELRALSARHEVVAVEVRDPRDAELPPVGLLTLVDPETGRLVDVPTGNRKVRERFAAAAAAQRDGTARAVRAAGASHLVLSTDRDWMLDVVRFVASRRRRR
jgi:uncharacterized protein (DUF58 family)